MMDPILASKLGDPAVFEESFESIERAKTSAFMKLESCRAEAKESFEKLRAILIEQEKQVMEQFDREWKTLSRMTDLCRKKLLAFKFLFDTIPKADPSALGVLQEIESQRHSIMAQILAMEDLKVEYGLPWVEESNTFVRVTLVDPQLVELAGSGLISVKPEAKAKRVRGTFTLVAKSGARNPILLSDADVKRALQVLVSGFQVELNVAKDDFGRIVCSYQVFGLNSDTPSFSLVVLWNSHHVGASPYKVVIEASSLIAPDAPPAPEIFRAGSPLQFLGFADAIPAPPAPPAPAFRADATRALAHIRIEPYRSPSPVLPRASRSDLLSTIRSGVSLSRAP